jgi:CheY-like chemotaxis protein
VKFTERGSVTLRLNIVPQSPSELLLRYDVADTGVGIPAPDIPRLFDVFTQAQNGRAGKFGGAGLGLAISRKLAVLMGGRIDVRSTLGRGSVFTLEVTLPVSATVRPADAPETALAGERPIGGRVLVVEDNAVNQKLVRLMLTRLGCHVEIASSGPEAIGMAAGGGYDLVLMDWQMPGMDGLETARRLKAQWTEGAEVPIVAVTASAMQGDREACLAAGMCDYLAKPIDIASLARVVERWSGGRIKT